MSEAVSDTAEQTVSEEDSWCEKCDVEREDGLLVCVNCGRIFNKSAQQLADDPTRTLTTNCNDDDVKAYVSHLNNRFPVGKRLNTEDIDRLVANLSLGADVKTEAIAKFKHMIEGYFRGFSKQNKRILAGICVYTSLINEKTWVTIGHMCNTVGCSNSEFCKVYNQVVREYPQYKTEQVLIEDLVCVTLSEMKIEEQEKKKLCHKVQQIIELERECWMIEGRTPVHIIFAATFLAWKSMDPYNRRKTKLTDFCRTVGIDYKHTTSQRVTELFNAIVTLAANGPLGKRTINKNNIGIYLDKILDYKNSLIYDFNNKIQNARRLQGFEANSDGTPNMFAVFKRKFKSCEESDKSTDSGKMPVNGGGDGEEEIDDEEIDRYLRTDAEVRFFKKLKTLETLCEEDDEDV